MPVFDTASTTGSPKPAATNATANKNGSREAKVPPTSAPIRLVGVEPSRFAAMRVETPLSSNVRRLEFAAVGAVPAVQQWIDAHLETDAPAVHERRVNGRIAGEVNGRG